MELQAITGQLFVRDGEVVDAASVPGLLALQTPSDAVRGRQRDFLFGHLTLSGRPEETATLAQDLLDLVAQVFYQSPGSVTAALRGAIMEASKRLLALNLSGSGTFREGAVSCAVLRSNQLFMAQTGESFALLGHNFGIERLPKQEQLEATPLGRTAGLSIRYFHNYLQSGDMLMLAGPRLSHLPVQAFRPVLIDSDVEDGLATLSGVLAAETARVMLVEFTDDAPGYMPEAGLERSRLTLPVPLALPTGQPLREARPGPASTADVQSTRVLPDLDVEAMETTARKATSRVARMLSKLTGWTADLLSALRPVQQDGGSFGNWAIPGFLAVAIPLLVALVVTGVYVQRGRVVRFSEIKQSMMDQLTLARQVGSDPVVAGPYFQRVIDLSAEAQELRPGDAEVLRLRQEALVELDGLSGVTRLSSERIYGYGPDVGLVKMALGDQLNGDVYVIDGAGNRVFRHPTDEEYADLSGEPPQLILFAEQVVGSHVVEQTIDLIWRPRGNQVTRDGLAVLDGRGALVTFYPNFEDTRAVTLGLASDWVAPRAIAQFTERLYVLDPRAQKIWRYFAEGDGLEANEDQRAIEFVDDPELDKVIDFEIYGEDGSVILLYEDGRLRRYVNGRLLWGEADLAANGLVEPVVRPVSVKIAGRGLNSSIFVADPGTARILQFSIGGTFLAQFKATDTTGAELYASVVDFEVANDPLRLFAITSDSLFLNR